MNRQLSTLRIVIPLLAALLAACSGAPADPILTAPAEGYPAPGTAFPTPLPPPNAYPVETEGQPPAAVSGPAEALVAQARAELAARAAVDPASIQTVEVTQQAWPDASLGCPQEGQLYAQVVTDGYRIVLETAGQRYVYHTDRDKAVYCPQDPG